jgi:hypothetical protein
MDDHALTVVEDNGLQAVLGHERPGMLSAKHGQAVALGGESVKSRKISA